VSAAVAKWRIQNGQPLGVATDRLHCMCPIIRCWMITANDLPWWESSKIRTDTLLPFSEKLADTKGSDGLTRKRMWLVMDAIWRQFTPIVLRYYEKDSMAQKLEDLPEVTTDSLRQLKAILIDIHNSLLDANMRHLIDFNPDVMLIHTMPNNLADAQYRLFRLVHHRSFELGLMRTDVREKWINVARQMIEMTSDDALP